MAPLPTAALSSRASVVVQRRARCKQTARHGKPKPFRVMRCTASSESTTRRTTLAPVALSEAISFYEIKALIRPWRLNDVLVALDAHGIRGLTTYEAKGAGVQAASFDESGIALVDKTVLNVVLEREQVQDVVDIIVDAAQTGEIGDGKIFISPVADVVRIRTGETGADAERMAGGRRSMMKGE